MKRWIGMLAWMGAAALWVAAAKAQAPAPAEAPEPAAPAAEAPEPPAPPPPARVAVLSLDVKRGFDVDPGELRSRVATLLEVLPGAELVARDEIEKAAAAQRVPLAGLVSNDAALRVGKALGARYAVVGAGSKIGNYLYLVVKLVDVPGGGYQTISAKAPAVGGVNMVLARLESTLAFKIQAEQAPPVEEPEDEADEQMWAQLRQSLDKLRGKTFVLADAAAPVEGESPDEYRDAMEELLERLRGLGLKVMVADQQARSKGWRERLIETGRFGSEKVDFLIEAQGNSRPADRFHGIVSCLARVDLKVTAMGGRYGVVTDRGVAAKVDLVEALAAKRALEAAADKATVAAMKRIIAQTVEPPGAASPGSPAAVGAPGGREPAAPEPPAPEAPPTPGG